MTGTKMGGQSTREPAAPTSPTTADVPHGTAHVTIPAVTYDELVADQRLLRALLDDDRAVPDGPLWRAVRWLAEELAVRHLRSLSHDLAESADWKATSKRPSHTELERRRTTYDRPRTAEEIRRQARESWGLPV